MQGHLRDWKSQAFIVNLSPCPIGAEICQVSLKLLMKLRAVGDEISYEDTSHDMIT